MFYLEYHKNIKYCEHAYGDNIVGGFLLYSINSGCTAVNFRNLLSVNSIDKIIANFKRSKLVSCKIHRCYCYTSGKQSMTGYK